MNSGLDAYQLIDRFAVGGAAEVYRARDRQSGQLVAIKRLRPDIPFDPEVSGGFLREIQLAMLSHHQNLIRGLDRGTHQGLDYVVVEYVAGKDLDELLAAIKQKRIIVPDWIYLYITRELLAGLAFAHQMRDHSGFSMGLVHRDVNPRNVLIDYNGHVKLADFGAAIATHQEPAPDEIVGSPGYLSPEQANLAALDHRSDIFAVGCVLYEMITGERAFDFSSQRDMHILQKHMRGEIRPIPADVREPVRLLIEIACAPNPEDRYVNAETMRAAVDNVLRDSGEPHPAHKLGALLRQAFADEFRSALQQRRGRKL